MEDNTYQLADVSTRFVALFIDGIILGIITGALFGIGRGAGAGVSFIVGAAYYAYFFSQQNGQSPGKSLMGIRVIKTDGTPITAADAIIRYVGYYVNTLVFFLGWLWPLVDSNRQGFHDKLAHTYVVIVPK